MTKPDAAQLAMMAELRLQDEALAAQIRELEAERVRVRAALAGDEAYRAASDARGRHRPVCQGAATVPVNVMVNVSDPDSSLYDTNRDTHRSGIQHVHHDICGNHSHHATVINWGR
jgi:hypothetical protein